MKLNALSIAILLGGVFLVTRGAAQTMPAPYCFVPSVVTPGHAIRLHCSNYSYGPNAQTDVRAELVPISIAEAKAMFRGADIGSAALARAAVDVATFQLKERDEAEVVLRPRGIGEYLIRLQANGREYHELLSSVSSIGIATLRAVGTTLAAPIDLGSDTISRGDVTVVVEPASGAPETLRSGLDGIFDSPTEPSSSNGDLLVAHAADGSIAIESR